MMDAGASPRLPSLPSRIVLRRTLAAAIILLAAAAALALLPLKLAAALLFGIIGLVLLLLRPVWGLMVLIPVIPFSSLLSLQIGGVQFGAMEALVGLVTLAWLLQMTARRRIVIPHPPLLLPWLLWLGFVLLSWVNALSLGGALAETAKWLEMLALYLFIVANVRPRHLPWLLGATLFAGVAQACIGIYQYRFGVGPEGFLLLEGSLLRAYGTFRQPNPYAGYLGITFPFALSLLLHQLTAAPAHLTPIARWIRHRGKTPWQSLRWLLTLIAAAAATALILGGIYVSQSRGAWIGVAGAAAIVLSSRSRKALIFFGVLAVVLALLAAMGAAALLPTSIAQRFNDVLPVLEIPNIATAEVTDANFPTIERLAHWQAAADMWRDHLWLGVGTGNYAAVYPAYAIGRWVDPLGHAHNIYLNTAAETGLLGLLAYLSFWLAAFALVVRTIRATSGFQRALAVGAAGVLVFFSLHNGVDNLYVQGMYLQIAITLGILAVLSPVSGCISSEWFAVGPHPPAPLSRARERGVGG
jgi:putative inorganic carbon (hco3(-)) transporter